ncbi:Soyasapogenol B glucuronide galactosyltransferase [Spatholobus suberectus]|nr:Soyasapogenol B glucuronide galactosyltransferase [Spatholobus suberectus]
MTCLQLPTWLRAPTGYTYLINMMKDSERRSNGSLFNTFCELKGAYEEHYNKAMRTKSWSVGPISFWVNQDALDKANRGHAKEGQEGEGKEEGWLTWLDCIELCSLCHDFIWVVRKKGGNDFLQEFQKRVRASIKGYLMWGWAPQLLLLDHPAIGAVVTHCGWNTIIESANAVGAKESRNWKKFGDEVVKREETGKAIAVLMGGGEGSLEMRKRAKALSDAAKKTVQVGGSSHNNLKELIQELKSFKLEKINNHKSEANV